MRQKQKTIIRLAKDEDFESIYQIWEEGVIKMNSNAVISRMSFEKFKGNFENRKDHFNFWVMEEDNKILAWCSILPAFSHPLKFTTEGEVSLYVNNEIQKKGVGTTLMIEVYNNLINTGIENIWGFAKSDNLPSIKMCEKAGMKICGHSSTKTILLKEYL